MALDLKELAEIKAKMEKMTVMEVSKKNIGPVEPLVFEERLVNKKPFAWEVSTSPDNIDTQKASAVEKAIGHTDLDVRESRAIEKKPVVFEQSTLSKSRIVNQGTAPTEARIPTGPRALEKPMAWERSASTKSAVIQNQTTTRRAVTPTGPRALEKSTAWNRTASSKSDTIQKQSTPFNAPTGPRAKETRNKKQMDFQQPAAAKDFSTHIRQSGNAMDWGNLGIKGPAVLQKPALPPKRKLAKKPVIDKEKSNTQEYIPIQKSRDDKNTSSPVTEAAHIEEDLMNFTDEETQESHMTDLLELVEVQNVTASIQKDETKHDEKPKDGEDEDTKEKKPKKDAQANLKMSQWVRNVLPL